MRARRPRKVRMNFRLTALLCALAALFAVAMVPAAAGAKKAKGPKVTAFTPKQPEIGGTLKLKGGPFSSKKKRNTVVLRAPNGATTFVKPKRARKRKLVLRIPATVERLFRESSAGLSLATKFRVRVLSGRKFGPWTKKRRSPVIQPSGSTGPSTPADCDKDGLPNSADPNDDNDLLDDELEKQIKTDVCLADTDQDGMEDGWEYYAAKDLNIAAVPYPGKRPFPNPLDPSDREIDFDGDSLYSVEEHDAWVYTGRLFDAGAVGSHGPESPLYYSDGTQRSRLSPSDITVPQWRGGEYGVPTPGEPFPETLDRDGDGVYQDDERDADADGLINYIETHGPGSEDWWAKKYSEEWPNPYYGVFTERPFLNLYLEDSASGKPVADPQGFLNPDSDGDTLLDGEDDQDNDDVSNVLEMYFETVVDQNGNEFVTNAFNPCAPDQGSRTCPRYQPFPED